MDADLSQTIQMRGVDSANTELDTLGRRSWIENFRELMSSRVDYSTTLPIGISDHNQKVVLFHITVLIRVGIPEA